LERYDEYPDSFKTVIPYLLASIVHHFHTGWLRQNIVPTHPIWSSKIFANAVNYNNVEYPNIVSILENRVLLGRNYCNQTYMQATGVPDHFKIAEEVNAVRVEFSGKLNELKRSFDDLSQSFQEFKDANAIELPLNVCRTFVDNFQVAGSQATPQVIRGIIRDELEIMIDRFGNVNRNPVDEDANDHDEHNELNEERPIHRLFSWGRRDGRLFKEEFTFTNMAAKSMWNLWHFGNSFDETYPYKEAKIRKQIHDLKTSDERVRYSKAAYVMEYFEEQINFAGIKDPDVDVSSLNRIEADRMFDEIFPLMMEMMYPDGGNRNRVEDLTYTTMHNRLTAKK
jgi:hypothetical protein